MMNFRLLPRDMRFFDLFERVTLAMGEAAQGLSALLNDYRELTARLAELEALEHRGDQATHEIMSALNKTFITPLDREDITALAHALDDVTDFIWAAADRLRVFKIEQTTPASQGMARVLVEQTAVLGQAVRLLRETRQMAAILPLTVEINRLENQADDLLRAGIGELFAKPDDPRDIVLSIKWREIYEFLEQASDKAEDAANVLEAIVLKHA
jgi:hypothetical protein